MARNDWTPAEIDATVAAYFEMYRMHERDEPFVKADFIRSLLATALQNRTKGAVEMRFGNISAVLQERHLPWLKGYVPYPNYPAALVPAVLRAAEGLIPLSPTSDPVELDKSTKLAKALGPLEKPKGRETPESTSVTSKVFKRDPLVRAYVLEEAGGKCELCDHPAPFEDKDGAPFLEVHHVKTLAEGGADTAENSVALCPNCHRSLHLAKDREQRLVRLHAKVSRLENR
ncbi:HNH endonuclease [Hyalangium minutum]|uniref:5-methylcytosine-specific restriction enzyme A n=1 Tax=Hyalangium minutum TaxID=394096 RepID=A0A085WGE7_9BACT|nr:HNH endonuclease [Hyalangium minutum]KFE66760.1 5-methylcytosine-specific restriction enzyme A [Hyalangium minutum]